MRTLLFDESGVHKFCEHPFFVFDRPVDEKSLDFSIQLWLAVAFDRQHPSKFGDDVVVQVENEQLRGEIDDLLDADVGVRPLRPGRTGEAYGVSDVRDPFGEEVCARLEYGLLAFVCLYKEGGLTLTAAAMSAMRTALCPLSENNISDSLSNFIFGRRHPRAFLANEN